MCVRAARAALQRDLAVAFSERPPRQLMWLFLKTAVPSFYTPVQNITSFS